MPSSTPAIMLQGTCSNAGKSLLTAALCRILTRRGLRVAPFKAQNMALNSFVTAEGCEIGRAQALQAAAACRQPDVRMNPVLLKPNSDTGSQVIVMGRPVGQMRVAEYFRYKPRAWEAVTAAYDSLAAEVDVMVLEGAGSPAEINLKAYDIVNMRMAAYAEAKVLLTADIDRGGAFAALAGTMLLLDEDERARIAGFILNKFRGDASLLTPALDAIQARTGKPFVGVVPWLEGLRLPEEDSVSFKLHSAAPAPAPTNGAENLRDSGAERKLEHLPERGREHMSEQGAEGLAEHPLDVVLLDMPHISNFTDVDALRCEPDVRLRVVRRAEDLGAPDMIILAGSKNTIGDLRWLKAQGLAATVRHLALSGRCTVVGVCGGLQMLGAVVRDPLGLECGGEEAGLALLPLITELGGKKTLTRLEAQHCATGLPVRGYEIHHGNTAVALGTAQGMTEGVEVRPAVLDAQGTALGWERTDLPVWGTYLHGVFDADAFRRRLLNGLRRVRGLQPVLRVTEFSVEPELERLADTVEQALDMAVIVRMLGL